MSIKKRAVSVCEFPRKISAESEIGLLRNLQAAADGGHSRFVLDCSAAATMDLPAIRLLLSCLEEVMKHNGDVRLAMLSPEGYSVLQETGIGRLFESYASTENAIRSYQMRPTSLAPLPMYAEMEQDTEYAA